MGRGQGKQPMSGDAAATPRHISNRPRRPYKWTDERIEEELRALLLRTRGRLPSARDLERQGLAGLRGAMRYRGVPYWARRLGVSLRPRQDRQRYPLGQAIADMRSVVAEEQKIVGWDRARALGYPRLASYLRMHRLSSIEFCRRYEIRP